MSGLVNSARVKWMKASQQFCVALHERTPEEEEEEGGGVATPLSTAVREEEEEVVLLLLLLLLFCKVVEDTTPLPPFALKRSAMD